MGDEKKRQVVIYGKDMDVPDDVEAGEVLPVTFGSGIAEGLCFGKAYLKETDDALWIHLRPEDSEEWSPILVRRLKG